MKVTTITFTLDRSIPVQTLSGREADRYASIRPAAAVTIEGIDADLSVDQLDSSTATIRAAFDYAADRCFEQLKEVHDALRDLYKPQRSRQNTD
jgi:hypothetical protein